MRKYFDARMLSEVSKPVAKEPVFIEMMERENPLWAKITLTRSFRNKMKTKYMPSAKNKPPAAAGGLLYLLVISGQYFLTPAELI